LGDTHVIYFIDTDQYDRNPEHERELKEITRYCEDKNGYPPQYSPEVFNKVMEQVENFEEYSESSILPNVTPIVSADYQYEQPTSTLMVAEPPAPYGK
jgi:type I restriction enzyme R subunit